METLKMFWALFAPVQEQIISLFFTLFGGFILWLLRPKVKLVWGRSNNSIHFVQNNDAKTEIYCEKYFLQNTGRKPATDVQFVMSFKPDDFSIFPAREYIETSNPQSHHIAKLPFIAPGELIVIDVIYIQRRAASIEAVLCSERVGKIVNFITNRNFGTVFNVFALIVFFLGFAFVFQTLLKIFL